MSLAVVIASIGIANANAGVPMIFVALPEMLVALLPIVALEAFVLSRRLALPFLRSVRATAISNVASTIVGLPITWLLLVAAQMITGGGTAHGIETRSQKLLAVTWQAPWLIPYETEMHWMIPAAELVLLVPFFLASFVIEAAVNEKLLAAANWQSVRRATLQANALSYGLLALLVIGMLFDALRNG